MRKYKLIKNTKTGERYAIIQKTGEIIAEKKIKKNI